jgi:flagellar biogenesis protein FliO
VPSYAGYLLETVVTLALVCGLAVVVLVGARRLGVGRPTGPLEMRGHLPLDARRSIYLVKVGDRAFVVGVGEAGFTKLGEVPASELTEAELASVAPFASGPSGAAGASGATFATILARVLGRGRAGRP